MLGCCRLDIDDGSGMSKVPQSAFGMAPGKAMEPESAL
jgi:hypothetical protein